jgi:5-formyltetrahydrofolate cyclo-ligase
MSSEVSQNVQSEKSVIRRRLVGIRNSRSCQWTSDTSAVIREQLLSLPELDKADSVALYVAKSGEVQTDLLLVTLLEEGSRRICVPAYDAMKKCYGFCWISLATTWVDGPYGVSEPDAPNWAGYAPLGVIITPCVGFDRKGRRLGHGGGYYDRLLAEYGGYRMGLAFSFQEVESLPETGHDQRLNTIVTERDVHRC